MEKPENKLKASDYVHLHNHTQYSLLDGLTKLPALVERIKKLGMDSVAVTDHGTLSGAIEFYKIATSGGIKPVIGMEAYVAARSHMDKDPAQDRQYYHLTILASNNRGYLNLMRLSSLANLEGFYYRPRIDHELLEKHNEGLIVLSGCIGGEVSDALRQEQYEIAKKTAQWYKKTFGDRYYIELQDHGHPKHPTAWKEQNKVNQQLLKLVEELDIPAVVTCDAHYLLHEDQEAHEILLCVQTGAFLADENRFSLKEFELHVADPKDIIERWGKDHPELILNSKKIAERCNVDIELGKILIPKFPTPKGQNERTYLEEKVWQGLAWRYGSKSLDQSVKMTTAEIKKNIAKEVRDRAEYELDIVNKMGFNGYFLIVADFIIWGKDRGIVFGPGRGSAASSILAYALRITEIDPLKYDLLFERFLNPDRISMPDMDIDIQDSRRDEVIKYCIEKYGDDRVANIVTFGRMAARNSVRDVARVLQVPYAEADRLAKMIPPPVQGRHTPLSESLKSISELKAENNDNPQSARVFDLATKLEGTIRSHGVHAAGVVIAPDEIVKFAPLEMAQKGAIATQYSMGPVEELGLLKMDFLGLSNLTIIKNALRIIKKVEGKEIDISEIPLDDKRTFELFQKGETTGVFQFESSGMKRYLRQLKPTVFDDLIAMNALYRPGPMQFIEEFIARKHGVRRIEYAHPKMESALKNTYGVLVYQEQFMQISKDMCGFTGGQADTLRKAAGKKQKDTMAKMKKNFIDGMIEHSKTTKRTAEKIWGQIEAFSDYGFNKVHSACYSLIAYQTAYLKAHFPAAFMAALMTSDYDNTDRLAIEITECKHLGIEVLSPDINESFHEFGVVPGEAKIRFGLDAIKNVGHGAVEEILRARQAAGGRIEDINQYCKLVDCHIVNRKALESLIKAGALDSFADRGLLLNNVDGILSLSSKLQKDSDSGQVDLFGNDLPMVKLSAELKLESGQDYPLSQQLAWERELLGIYLSHHPLDSYQKILNDLAKPISQISRDLDGRMVRIGGSIHQIRDITTRNGSKMAFVRIADLATETELVVFPKVLLQTADVWQVDNVILVKGKIDYSRDNELKILVEEAKVISEDEAAGYKGGGSIDRPSDTSNNINQRLYIRLENSQNHPLLLTLKEKLDGYRGETEVVLVTGASASKQIIKLPQTISINEESLRDLASLFGSMNVVVR
ncbi:MAG TPA: DNA polymerase III subunit alpha [Candidatus Saccharimonadales bacterium]|nr:DNA polymerase III subunit alpha [Candidatus Saccharimonadales bacterium]